MGKSRNGDQSKPRFERVIFTLPPELAAEARQFAEAFYRGNNSGFVAAAIRNYIDHLRKVRHTAKMRQSYSAAAQAAGEVAAEWDAASEEAWASLERPKSRSGK
jgi:metal-responsive CopG/Arc/MetJ family transcriptional regulator